MSLNTTLDKIAANREKYSCTVETLGECKIKSPLVQQAFIREGERVFVTESELIAKGL